MVGPQNAIRVFEPDTAELGPWMERYQQADPDAPRILISALSPTLMRFFRSQGAAQPAAEDLLQDTWLRIHRVRHTYRPGEPLLPWVYAIARRVRVDHYRRNRRAAASEIPYESVPELPAGPVGGHSAEFDSLVAQLPEAQREVIVLMKVAGLSVEEVAAATSSTSGSVKQKAFRAYQKLREILKGGKP